MVCSITAVAVAPCGSASCSVLPVLLLKRPCRPSHSGSGSGSGSFKALPRLKHSPFSSGEPSLRDVLQLADSQFAAAARLPAGLPALHVVNSQKRQANSVAGSKGETNVLRSNTPSWDGSKALAVTEGFCIVVAAASYTVSVFQSKQPSLVASSSAGESKFLPKVGDLSTWYVPALWAALVINAILRAVQRKSLAKPTQVWEERGIRDFTLDQRVGKLEEDVQGVETVAQSLARHLEKLGVRFRVTRRTLQDPMQETVVLTKKTAEVVRELASRGEILETELQETQQVLAAMQAQQVKQLELLVAGLKKTSKSQRASEERILKELSERLGRAANNRSTDAGTSVSSAKKKGGESPKSRKQYLMKDIGSLWKGLVANEETSTSSSSSSEKKVAGTEVGQVQLKKEHPVDKQNGHAVTVPNSEGPQSNKSLYNPDNSFRKEDFWATTTVHPTGTNEYLTTTEIERTADGQPLYTNPQSSPPSGKLDSFFSNRKAINSSQADVTLSSRDSGNTGFNQLHSESGEHSSNKNSLPGKAHKL